MCVCVCVCVRERERERETWYMLMRFVNTQTLFIFKSFLHYKNNIYILTVVIHSAKMNPTPNLILMLRPMMPHMHQEGMKKFITNKMSILQRAGPEIA